MQEHEGWLTHLSPGVVSQLEIPLANHLQYKRKVKAVKTLTYILRIRILKRSVMTMIFDFEPWQLDIDIDLTKQLYRSCKGDFVWVEKK